MAKTDRKKLTDKLDKLCRNIVRIRDDMTCQHCGKQVSGSDAHTSHVIPKSRGNAVRWDLLNLKLLCYHCHLHWWHKSPTESGEWFKETYLEWWESLVTLREEEERSFQKIDYNKRYYELKEK